jgi:hypothetical protein
MSSKGVKQLVKDAEHQGFEVTVAKSGHYCFRSPEKGNSLIFISATPGDHRSLKNSLTGGTTKPAWAR